ncbi:hypothetical protein TA3x_003329 [Tundrisphaera sp. TA3]|uniref:hypothetical protein n=1 Tax=Tundrisphaera sp. TA3 TaxID=3435775 RepID=UPI003EB82EA5
MAVKLALMVNSVRDLRMLAYPILFVGARIGISLDRRRGGDGTVGGVIAGVISGAAIAAILNIDRVRATGRFDWSEIAHETIFYVVILPFGIWAMGPPRSPDEASSCQDDGPPKTIQDDRAPINGSTPGGGDTAGSMAEDSTEGSTPGNLAG